MKYGVSKQFLLVTAGLVWIIAGVNVLRIGIITWMNCTENWLLEVGEATVVFLLFYLLIFRKLYIKHTRRIEEKESEKHSPLSFFDTKGWLIMAFMIALGVTIRRFQLLPESFISVFYTGLSTALILTGILFLRYWWLRRN